MTDTVEQEGMSSPDLIDDLLERDRRPHPSMPGRRPKPGPGSVSTAAAKEARAPIGRNFAGPVVLAMSAGLLVQAWSAARSRGGDLGPATQGLFWVGLLLIFAPAAVRIMAARTPTRERLVLAMLVPVALQVSRLVLYPTLFVYHDELAHAYTLQRIEVSHHLFAANPLLPVSSYYPGLELVTDAVAQMTGLPAHTAAAVVLLLARVLLTAALIALMLRLTGSARVSCLAGLVYACNPQEYFFNAQFSYQTLALPLAVFVVLALVARRSELPTWRSLAVPMLALVAVAVSHHLTSMLLLVTLAAWALVDTVVNRRRAHPDRRPLLILLGGGVVAVGAWLFVPGNPVLSYLGEIADSSAVSIRERFTGQTSRQLFQNANGLSSPLWERVATVASILVVVVMILGGYRVLRGWFSRRRAFLTVLGLTALLYPIIPLGHVTASTGEVTDRASGFVFIGVAVAAATGPLLHRRSEARARLATVAGSIALVVVFVGAIILGSGPTVAQLPGPYLVSADARSIDRFNLAAARWEATHLGNSRVYADRDSGLLAGAIGHQYVITHLGTGIDASPVLLAPTFTPTDVHLIREADIDYVIVDQRDSSSLPNLGVYIESGEYGGLNRRTPVPASALRKLASVPGVQRIYSDGAIAIYDVRSLHT